MAITFQSKLDEQAGTTVAFDVGSGTNRWAMVSVMRRSGSTISATYAGISMTQIGSLASTWNAGDTLYIFVLSNPTSGSNNIVITHNGTLVRWNAAAYNGVNQTTVSSTSNVTTNTTAVSGTLTVSVTPTTPGWIVAGQWANVNTTYTADGNTTLRTSQASNVVIDSNAQKSSAYAIGGTADNNGVDMIGFALLPASTVNANFLAFM